MTKVKFDKNGMFVSQKLNYKIKHDEEIEELIENKKRELLKNDKSNR